MLAEKVKAAAQSRRPAPRQDKVKRGADASFMPDGRIIAIGASTGGVEALITVLSQFPPNCPPTVISQHMPATFTRSFAARLNSLCAASVCEATDGAPMAVGQIYLAPGDFHLELTGSSQGRCRLSDGPKVNGPSPLGRCHVQIRDARLRRRAIGVILTGMGRDGADGLLELRSAGAETIGQDEQSSVVYGMPRVAFEQGAVARQLPLERIGETLVRLANSRQTQMQRA